ncbi:MAG: adenine phosphoribosyltransferase [Solirubrobacterales bacterium]
MDLRGLIRDVPDFPVDGILFRDITPLLLDPAASREVTDRLAGFAESLEVDFVVAAEARGFIFGGSLAQKLNAGFIPARKPGRLPSGTVSAEYELEYGLDELHIHADSLAEGARVLIHDDLIATGGTAEATIKVVEKLGGQVVGCAFLAELTALGGRNRLAGRQVHSLVKYD